MELRDLANLHPGYVLNMKAYFSLKVSSGKVNWLSTLMRIAATKGYSISATETKHARIGRHTYRVDVSGSASEVDCVVRWFLCELGADASV